MSVTGRRARHAGLAVVAAVCLATVQGGAGPGNDAEPPAVPATAVTVAPEAAISVVPGPDPAARTTAVSRLVFEQSPVVVVSAADPESVRLALEAAGSLRVPVLAAAAPDLDEELTRLDATTVLTVAPAPLELDDERHVLPRPGAVRAAAEELAADFEAPESAGDGLLVLTLDPAVDALALATLAGGTVVHVPGGDPRADPAIAAQLRAAGSPSTVLLGDGWSAPEYTLQVVRSAPEQPGGGHLVLPGRHIIALYGSPGTAALGLLGEQGAAESVVRTQGYVQQYAGISDRPVVGAFELIATIADAVPGPDGDYSLEVPVEELRPWVDAAREAGMYAILDLQPGRTDFLTQAQRYTDLLLQPHVGLALDPEWRLAPDQVHLRQFGTVSGAEVNAVADWLAALTRDHGLPQKPFVLHQFTPSMINAREQIRTDRPELATIIHVDGQGAPPDKVGTWNLIRTGAPVGTFWGWKNFLDEDLPMLTPEQTWGVGPRPDLVTYQ